MTDEEWIKELIGKNDSLRAQVWQLRHALETAKHQASLGLRMPLPPNNLDGAQRGDDRAANCIDHIRRHANT